ncbi:MAG: ATP-dependent helicase, partial [Spirochaetota bacterium]
EKKDLIRDVLTADKKLFPKIMATVLRVKQHLLTKEDLENPEEARIFELYETALTKYNAFDLDDLLYRPCRLFMDNEAILLKYRTRYRFILVDEYQDINFPQYRLLKTLMPEENSNLYVIGDPNQAIYGFRGADVAFIRRFKEDYPPAAIYTLQKSYRCTDNILRASHNLITLSHKGSLENDSLLQGVPGDVKIKICEQASDKSEAEFTARTIENMMGGLRFFSIDSDITGGEHHDKIESLSDFAVLCRLTRQMDAFEKAFKDHSIPYQRIGESALFIDKPSRTIMEVLEFLLNPENIPVKNRLISDKVLTAQKADRFEHLRQRLISPTPPPVKELIEIILDKELIPGVAKNEHEITGLLGLAENYGNRIREFISTRTCGSGVDVYNHRTEEVTLMTIHAAKGLEFQCVFIAGCEDGLLPYSLFDAEKCDFEEERRIFYVGMTRARQYLFLTYAKTRTLFGRLYRLDKSPYLSQIEEELLEKVKPDYTARKKPEDRQLSLF